jgi:multidrug resistance efflux pump
MEKDKINIELKSEVLNEVLSAPPSWLVRSGNTLFFFFIVLLIALSCLISYPDELVGDVNINSNRPPVEFQNQMYSKLVDLQVKDQQNVKKGKVLAQFDNKIHPAQIQLVRSFLNTIQQQKKDQYIEITKALEAINLGVLQSNWTSLLTNIKEQNGLRNSDILNKKINSLKNEIAQRIKLQNIANQKLKLIEKEIKLQEIQTASANRLLSKNAISREEFLKEEKNENQLNHQYQNQKEALVQNDIQLNTLMKNVSEMEYEGEKQIQQLQSTIKTSIGTIQNSINDWEKNTAWIAPFDGKILFNKQLNISSFYPAGDASLVIVPKGNYFTGLMKVPNQGAGKIEKGQKVFIEIKDFQKNDYGMIEGKVKSITSISKNDQYEVEIQLPKKLITTYNKEIPLKAQLKGTAKIITKNKRLIERFFEKVINIIEK